ncbi:MAG: hypothetical protein IJQ67_03875 [Bacilli bacterium]|nr:hypothetical protein [Bacilli bacterium]
MAKVPFVNRKKSDTTKIENRKNLHKLYAFITIVGYHQSDQVVKLFESVGSGASFIQVGQGTSKNKAYDILGIHDDKKGVILSIVRDDKKEEAIYLLNEYLTGDGSTNKGISFSIPLNSVIGARLYYFLTNSY